MRRRVTAFTDATCEQNANVGKVFERTYAGNDVRMYIGLGTILLILLVVLIVRRA
ncbi:MAG TPA: hypothetical protein VFV00_10120 [Acidimicrobiales bacterium]|nr:hypothetical protein [Acidimicrobiales bacterium]